ncbi:conserved hypothetical protein [Perkinsus marinus ATCC 50983]|uniref:CNNM transmembrane domain-containing protein n=1 Tax=Perkinsus marinus (strain ATCC 50983 / TXsc) TaxID=423536 RepID=C5KFE2_PERM5|nr:conserved hypothetical protein [Perkinsus marinus ATCC 50983]EER16802.1 conserved hypothetical protein [Perkinsus marinus ATCC 50983]|eukprot:XP_002785006.1 conserved hypothetical protein [Perkinsus marinus ATCC 50983]
MTRLPLLIFIPLILTVVSAAPTEADWQTVTAKFNPTTNEIVYNNISFEGPKILDHSHYVFNTIMTVICVICAALASGLTMGLVSLDDFDLRILMESSEEDVPDPADKAEMRKEKRAAVRLFLMVIFYPVAGPVAWCLDKTLGEEHKGRYNKAEFKALLNLHQYDEVQLHSRGGITKEELRMMQGALELHRLKVKDVMTPLDQVAMYSADQALDAKTLQDIVEKGHSRLPIYQGYPHNVHGMLLVKRLITLNPGDAVRIGNTDLLEPMICDMETTLLDMLYEFSTGRSHLAVATDDPERVIEAIHGEKQIPCNIHMAGIITLEDVIERLIKHDIQDESDISVTLQPVLHLPSSTGGKIKIPASPHGRSIKISAPTGVLSIKHQPPNSVGRSASVKSSHAPTSQAGRESPSLRTPLLKDTSSTTGVMPVITETSPMSAHSTTSSKSKKDNPASAGSTVPSKSHTPSSEQELTGKKDANNTTGENDLAKKGECKMSNERWD